MADPVIEAADIPRLDRPFLLDVRDRDSFAAGHAESAIRVPVEAWIEAARTEQSSFDNLDHWQAEISALGLTDALTAVIFDDGRMTEAARVWFVLQFFGARAVIVNGGWPALKGESVALSIPVHDAGEAFRARVHAGPVGLVTRDRLKAELGSTAILDARTEAEFSGTDSRNNARAGHLPGARLLPHADLLEDGRVKSAGTLRRMLSAAGFQPGDHIVTHCDGGGRAALAAIAAMRAGFNDVHAYYLSFSDWARDESCPVL